MSTSLRPPVPTLLPLALSLSLLFAAPVWASSAAAPAKAAAAKADKDEKDSAGKAEKSDKADKADKAEKAEKAEKAGKETVVARTVPARPADNLELLRERLAEKLGATKPAEAPGNGLVRVTSRLSLPAAAESHAPVAHARKAPATLVAAVDAHRLEKAAAHTAGAPAAHAAHWAYGGEAGPQAWGGLKPEFATCGSGTRQSPIDIRGGIAVDLEPVLFDYRASGFRVLDNGHTVQVNIGAGNSIEAMGRRYELVQFHFHRPSEERVNGRQFDMDVHLVHKDPEGRLAVVAVLLERGAAQPLVQTVWNNLPLEKNEEQPASTALDLNHLLPADRGYYTYMGSLTTPPCSEGVLWMVMRQPVALSQGQIDIFSRLYPMNARPVQSAAGRLIKQSQ